MCRRSVRPLPREGEAERMIGNILTVCIGILLGMVVIFIFEYLCTVHRCRSYPPKPKDHEPC